MNKNDIKGIILGGVGYKKLHEQFGREEPGKSSTGDHWQ